MSAAIVNLVSPQRSLLRERAGSVTPSLTLQSTSTGWGLFDERSQPVEADGPRARLACVRRAFALGVVRLSAGEQPHV